MVWRSCNCGAWRTHGCDSSKHAFCAPQPAPVNNDNSAVRVSRYVRARGGRSFCFVAVSCWYVLCNRWAFKDVAGILPRRYLLQVSLSLSLCAPWLQLACMCHAPVWARSRSAWRCCSRTGPASWWPSRSARWLLRCAFTAAVATNTRKRAQGSADREACFSILTSTLGRTASADPGRAVGGDKFDGDVARMTQRWRMVRCALVRVPHALRVIIHTRVTRSANLQTLTISRTSTTWPTAQ